MILSDKTLKQIIADKVLIIDPISEEQIQPSSIDCYLGTHFLFIEDKTSDIISFDKEIKYREFNETELILPAHQFILATTREYIKLPNNIAAFVEGRSSIGRMGLFIQNSGWIDAGFEGKITLELYNANSLPIKLFSNWRICQLVFCLMDQEAVNPYRGKYQGQNETVGSRIYQDKEITQS